MEGTGSVDAGIKGMYTHLFAESSDSCPVLFLYYIIIDQDCHQRDDGGAVRPILHRDIKVLHHINTNSIAYSVSYLVIMCY